MRVTVEHLKGNVMQVFVVLTETEQSVIQKHNLSPVVIHERRNPEYQLQLELYQIDVDSYAREQKMRPFLSKFYKAPQPPDKVISLTVEQLCAATGKLFMFQTQAEARKFDEDLRTTILPKLKDIIDYNAKPPTSKTYEL